MFKNRPFPLHYCVRCNKPFLRDVGRTTLTCSPNCSKDLTKHKELSYGKLQNKINYRKFRSVRLNDEINQKLGEKCIICGKKIGKINCHEIHGKRHILSSYYILTHIEDFVRLCNKCHQVLHVLSELSDSEINEIVIMAKRLRELK
jgi:hypothetical protein